jgi:NADH dehydrogenase
MGVLGNAKGTYELGGPVAMTFRELMTQMLDVIRRRRIVLNIPFFAATAMAFGFDMLEKITLGLVSNGMITRDQVKNLRRDNVVAEGAQGFDALGIEPTAMVSVLPEYLWRFRPSGQYDAIKESASNLRSS